MVKTRAKIPELSKDELNFFWSQIQMGKSNECWIWIGYKNSENYGVIKINGLDYRANRVSWTIQNGKIPDGKLICHTCDNPPCCNPNHLKAETQKWNMQDRESKGRSNRATCERHWNAKMTRDKVISIREKYATGKFLQREIGEEYGVSSKLISSIISRHRWNFKEEISI